MASHRPFRIAITALLVATLGPVLSGQAPAPTNLRVVVLGGFLGWVDGLVLPGDLTTAYGGLYGAQRWLDAQDAAAPLDSKYKRGRDLLLLTGNNRAARLGTASDADIRFAALQPDAVAVSVDDFLRSLRPAGRAGIFAGELANHNQPPHVVSNAFVRLRKKGMNTIVQPGLTLGIEPDESVGWVKTMTATCAPDACPGRVQDKETVRATLTDGRNRNPVTVAVTPSTNNNTLTLTFAPHLRPGADYKLVVTAPGKTWNFTFKTHRALTMAKGSGTGTLPAELDGLPVQHVSRDVGADRASIVILGFVDPEVKSQLGADRWKWTVSNSLPSLCDGDECEIDFMPATDAFAALDSSLAAGGTRGHTFYAAISGLSDRQATGLITEAKKIDLMVMDPDTFLMGQDLGDTAVVAGRPLGAKPGAATTQVWTRPHWVGARADILSTELTWNQPRWTMGSPIAAIEDIKGEKIHWDLNGTTLRYSLDGARNVTLGDGAYQAYRTNASQGTPESKPPANGLWISKPGTAAMLLDVMRRRAKTDLAMLPATAVDTQVMEWLQKEAVAGPLNWMSRFILEKAIYQMDHVAVAEVEGSKLAATLKTIVKAQVDGGDAVFISGIGAAGASPTIDEKTLRINEREIVATHMYRIALPQSLAEAQALTTRGDGIASLLDAADLRLRDEKATLLDQPEIATALEKAFSGRPRSYLNVTGAKISLNRTEVTDPDGAFATIPIAGRSVKPQEKVGLSGFVDLGADFRTFAFRATSDMAYAREETGAVVSYPQNEWTYGGRIDVRMPDSWLSRVFVGVFTQTWFRDQRAPAVTPTRPYSDATGVVANVTVAGAKVTPVIEEPLYKFIRFGAERDTAFTTTWLTLKNLLLAYDLGGASNDRETVKIGTTTLPLGEFYKGPSAFINAQFAAHPELFTAEQELTFTYSEQHRQDRFQFDAVIELTPPRTKELKLTTDLKLRIYLDGKDRPAYTADSSFELKSTMAWPFINRVTFGPFVEYYRVTAKDAPEPYSTVRYGLEMGIPIFTRLGWPGPNR